DRLHHPRPFEGRGDGAAVVVLRIVRRQPQAGEQRAADDPVHASLREARRGRSLVGHAPSSLRHAPAAAYFFSRFSILVISESSRVLGRSASKSPLGPPILRVSPSSSKTIFIVLPFSGPSDGVRSKCPGFWVASTLKVADFVSLPRLNVTLSPSNVSDAPLISSSGAFLPARSTDTTVQVPWSLSLTSSFLSS